MTDGKYKIVQKDRKWVSFFDYLVENKGILSKGIFTSQGEFIPITEIQFVKASSTLGKFYFLEATKDGMFLRLDLCYAADVELDVQIKK